MSNGTAATASSHYGYSSGTTLVFISAHENERAMKKTERKRETEH